MICIGTVKLHLNGRTSQDLSLPSQTLTLSMTICIVTQLRSDPNMMTENEPRYILRAAVKCSSKKCPRFEFILIL